MVVENGGSEAAECDIKIYFGGVKGAALVIRQAWRGRGGGVGRLRSLMQGAMGLGMLGRRQVKPRWANDTVWRHNVRKS